MSYECQLKSLFLKSLFYSFIPDQRMESSLQVKISSPARTVSIEQKPEDHLKQEPEDHLDLSKCLYLMYLWKWAGSERLKINQLSIGNQFKHFLWLH